MAKTTGIRPLWFVSPIQVQEDGNKSQIYLDEPVLMDDGEPPAPEEARPRGANALRAAPPPVKKATGYGFQMVRVNHITVAFTSKETAMLYAQQEAGKHPKVAYGVFDCCGVYETTTPTVIEKSFNESGELILKVTENGQVQDPF
jgi:hypothetical protein